jgi:predicted transcriptional regulator
MAATTTLKLPPALRARIAPLAECAGKSAHAWMVEALEAQAGAAEKRQAFIASALAAEAQVRESGIVFRANDVHNYIRAKVAGAKPRRPKPVKR